MAPKSKVSETGDIGHGVTFEVRPAKAGKPTVHVVIDGSRLPAFRLKGGSSATEQVRRLQQVDDHLARLTSGAPIDAGQPSGMAMDAMQGSQPTQPTHAATDAAQQEPPPEPHGCRREFQALARATAAAGCMVLPRTAAWAASESLPPAPWPFEDWADGGLHCAACGCCLLDPVMPVRCAGCDSLGESYYFFCDVKCKRRTACPHSNGILDLSIPCSCECCNGLWNDADLRADTLDEALRTGRPPIIGPLMSCDTGRPPWCDISTDEFELRHYAEAMVRLQGRKQRKAKWGVGDVLEGLVLALELNARDGWPW